LMVSGREAVPDPVSVAAESVEIVGLFVEPVRPARRR